MSTDNEMDALMKQIHLNLPKQTKKGIRHVQDRRCPDCNPVRFVRFCRFGISIGFRFRFGHGIGPSVGIGRRIGPSQEAQSPQACCFRIGLGLGCCCIGCCIEIKPASGAHRKAGASCLFSWARTARARALDGGAARVA